MNHIINKTLYKFTIFRKMAECLKMKSSERVSVLLDIVGKNTQVTLSVHELEIA